eukprot:jgi/Tetstr1/455446/TSEL_042275.t1
MAERRPLGAQATARAGAGGAAPSAAGRPTGQQQPAASRPPVAPTGAVSPRPVVAPPKFSDRGMIGGGHVARHSHLARQAASSAPGLLDSPVLLPMFTAEPSPTTGITMPQFPIPKLVGGEFLEKRFRPTLSTLRQDKQLKIGSEPAPKLQPSSSPTPSEDGYHWRKYGQKKIKGSPYPRSYFKCSFNGCPVKKVVEKDRLTGAVKSTIYSGNHTHAPRGPITAPLQPKAKEPPPVPEEKAELAEGAAQPTEAQQQDPQQLEQPADAAEEAGEPHVEDTIAPMPEYQPSPMCLATSTNLLLPVQPLCPSPRQMPSTPKALRRPEKPATAALAATPPRPTPSVTPVKADPERPMPVPSPLQAALTQGVPLPSTDIPSMEETMEALSAAVAQANVLYEARVASASKQAPAVSGQESGGDLKRPASESQAVSEVKAPPSKKRKSGGGPKPEAATPEEEEVPVTPEPYEALAGRLAEMQAQGSGPNGKEAKMVMWIKTDMDVLEDGYRWRKYGQKIVRSNPFPRSYYKCTHSDCGVRKHVERSGKDTRCIVATYEGLHNHEVPAVGSVPASKKNSARKSIDSAPRKSARAAEQAAATEAKANAGTEAQPTAAVANVQRAADAAGASTAALAAVTPSGLVTPKATMKAPHAGLPIMNLSQYDVSTFGDGTADTVLRTLDSNSTPCTSASKLRNLSLDLSMEGRSTEKRNSSLMTSCFTNFPNIGSGMASPGGLTWDPSGFLATPSSPGNITLPTPPGGITPPPGLSLPALSPLKLFKK